MNSLCLKQRIQLIPQLLLSSVFVLMNIFDQLFICPTVSLLSTAFAALAIEYLFLIPVVVLFGGNQIES